MQHDLSQNFDFLFFALIAAAWLLRSISMLDTLKHMPYIQPAASVPSDQPLITVIIPAKNEENNIGMCVSSLKAQDYKNFEILVINDNSTDKTEEILKKINVSYINNTTKTPEGWTGKNFALSCGAPKAQGEWLLFTDADTRHEPHCLSSVMTHIQKNQLDFLTLLPRCLADSFFENLIQPLAMAFLGLWFPIKKINDANSSVYFANGQFLMIKRNLYEKIGGHSAVREAFLEDFALAKRSKELKAKTQCAMGKRVYGTRMYDSFDSIWRGWRRIYQHAFQSHTKTLLKRALSVALLSCGPFAAAAWILLSAHPISESLALLMTSLLLFILLITFKAYRIVEANPLYAFLHPIAGLIIALILFDATKMAALKEKTVWR
jgi:chlorobactene glucosyltransferase